VRSGLESTGTTITAVAGMSDGTPVEGVFAVRRKERRLSRAGSPYLSLTLADQTGAMRALVFDQPDFFAERFSEGDRIRVAGRVSERSGKRELLLNHIRSAGEEVAAAELLPRSHREPDDLFGFVLHLADEITDPGLRRTVDALTGDDDIASAWKAMPCTQTGHHAYMGGLLEHSVGVASLAQNLCQWHPRLDSDLLLSGALVHDIGLTRAFRLGATFEETEEGRMLGHLAIGAEIVGATAQRADLSDERRLALLHVIGWHHGPPPGQGPGQASAEALALWRINSLESGVKSRLEGSGGAA
jgi:3'-5' exoribonuclease